MPAFLVQLFVIFPTLIFVCIMPVEFAASAAGYLRAGRNPRRLIVVSCAMLGFFAGGALLWNLVPAAWDMSFWTTLGATVNAAKYGHEIEHAAEQIVVVVMLGCLSGAAVSAAAAALGTRARICRQRG